MMTLELGMSAEQVSLPVIARFVECFGVGYGWSGSTVMRVNLLLEELVLNVRDHGVVAGRRFDVRMSHDGDRVRVCFSDDGVRFDPTRDAPAPDLTSGVMDRAPGGLGVYLVRSMSEQLNYRYVDGRNQVAFLVGGGGGFTRE